MVKFNTKISVPATTLVCAGAALVCAGLTYVFFNRKRKKFCQSRTHDSREAAHVLNYLKIKIVTCEEDCDHVVSELRKRTEIYRVVGFDCEWVSENGSRSPIALVQLSAYDGLCGLFRLNIMKTLPKSLKDILEDETIYKVGVVPHQDGGYLQTDYNVRVRSTLDLRHLAAQCGYPPRGLGQLTKSVLNIILDKYWKIRCSNWAAETLTDRQIHYAAADAHVAVKIFIKLVNECFSKQQNENKREQDNQNECHNEQDSQNECHNEQDSQNDCNGDLGNKCNNNSQNMYNSNSQSTCNGKHDGQNDLDRRGSYDMKAWEQLDELCGQYKDCSFSYIHERPVKATNQLQKNRIHSQPKQQRYPHAIRSKPLYNNCVLEAPDGEMLCTCDYKKAMWYVDKDLADIVDTNKPQRVRLRFEPAGRAVEFVGRYYKNAKDNRCVVCGTTASYMRKNVVPREYRKHFPEVMKDHSSHDVLLLCHKCHQKSNMNDQLIRQQLFSKCEEWLTSRGESWNHVKVTEDKERKKLRSAALALKSQKSSLPEERRKELENYILLHYPDHDEITIQLLEEAIRTKVVVENTEYESQGLKVVEYFKTQEGGLLRLEEIWRQHFLDSMQPQYLPEFWSVKHNEERLAIKLREGRLSAQDVEAIGAKEWLS